MRLGPVERQESNEEIKPIKSHLFSRRIFLCSRFHCFWLAIGQGTRQVRNRRSREVYLLGQIRWSWHQVLCHNVGSCRYSRTTVQTTKGFPLHESILEIADS